MKEYMLLFRNEKMEQVPSDDDGIGNNGKSG